jgi:hypothetical protein
MSTVSDKKTQDKEQDKRMPYKRPSIIYKGKISTRAGSPLSNPPGPEGADPSDLFGN